MSCAEPVAGPATSRGIRTSDLHHVRDRYLYPYGFAVLWTILATWTRCTLAPYLDIRAPFGTFFLSVLISAWLGGTGPAIAALVLGLLAASHFVIPPEGSLFITSLPDVFSLIVYFLVGITSITLFATLERRTRDAEHQASENQRLSEELQRTDRRKDEFLAVLAHELRNPLAAVKTGVALLCRQNNQTPSVIQTSAMLDRQIQQLSSLVNDLMDVSRYIRDDITLCREKLLLREIILEATEAVSAEMNRRRHHFQAPLPDAGLMVHADRVRLIQIITNLLTNAARYTPDGGYIELLTEVRGRWLRIEVKDNGIGIVPEFQDRIFDLFTQLEPVTTRRHGGLGLGLAIVQTLTRMHDGNISVHSEGRGRGTQFLVELPIMISTPASPAMLTAPVTDEGVLPPATETEGASQVVFIVDDNVDAAETLATLLRLEGFQVRCFEDGPQVLAAMAQTSPDSLLLDIGLPGLDGYEVARRVRLMAAGEHLQIVACTGWGNPSDLEKSHAAGINHHLLKPVDPQHLVHILVSATNQLSSR